MLTAPDPIVTARGIDELPGPITLNLTGARPLDYGTWAIGFACGCRGTAHPMPPYWPESPFGLPKLEAICADHRPHAVMVGLNWHVIPAADARRQAA